MDQFLAERLQVRSPLPLRNFSRRRFVCASVAGGLAAGLCLCAPPLLAAQADLPFVEAADGIFVRYGLQEMPTAGNAGAIANIGFIVGDESVAVIDTGTTRQQGEGLRRAVAKVTDRPISHLIATHVHLDHCFGHGAFADLRLRNIGHHRLPRALAERGPYYLEQLAALSPDFADTVFLPPDETVDDTLRIDLGNRPLTLTAWPAAHTDSDLTIFDDRTGLLWASDLLFVDRLPTIDGSLTGWLDALDRLTGQQVKTVMPGHGPHGSPAAPIAAERAYLTALRDRVRQTIEDGLGMSETVALLESDPAGDWLLSDDNHGRNILAAYAELEWE